jgi:hypothetical protein
VAATFHTTSDKKVVRVFVRFRCFTQRVWNLQKNKDKHDERVRKVSFNG